MITCPNCGAAARNGAKFCTTCGTKLNGILPTNSTSLESTPTTSESESRQEPAWSWPSISEAAPTEAVSAAPEPASPTSAVEWDWPAPFSIGGSDTEDGPTSETKSPVETEAEAESEEIATSAGLTSGQDDLTAWAAQWNAGNEEDPNTDTASTSEETNAPLAEHPSEDPGERIDDILIESADSAPAANSATASDDTPAYRLETALSEEHDTPDSPESQVSEDPIPQNPAPERTDDQEETAVSERSTQPDAAEQEPVDAPEALADDSTALRLATSTATRATALLDELRALLTASTCTGTDAGETALRPDIASSLRDAMGTEISFESLRTVAAQASEQPRDLYAMMDLGRHAGDILSLITERDRLRGAISDALATPSSPED